jgi:hypothetical protein
LPLGEQVLGGLGPALQPSQPRLLVHARDLLARREPLARDGDDLAVGHRLLGQHPAWEQLQALPAGGRGSRQAARAPLQRRRDRPAQCWAMPNPHHSRIPNTCSKRFSGMLANHARMGASEHEHGVHRVDASRPSCRLGPCCALGHSPHPQGQPAGATTRRVNGPTGQPMGEECSPRGNSHRLGGANRGASPRGVTGADPCDRGGRQPPTCA